MLMMDKSYAPLCMAWCAQVEASIQEALSGLAQGLSSLEQQLSEAGTSEAQLNSRLEKWTGGAAVHHSLGLGVGRGVATRP
jgi:hypothetical protein